MGRPPGELILYQEKLKNKPVSVASPERISFGKCKYFQEVFILSKKSWSHMSLGASLEEKNLLEGANSFF